MGETRFIFTSDHGYHMGQFGMPLDKRLPYDTDIRVPLIIVMPPINSHEGNRLVVDELAVVSVDLAPTVLDMARVETPNEMDGASLLPLIRVITINVFS